MRNGAVLNNGEYRTSTGVRDSRTASRELRDLVDRGIVEQVGTRGTTIYRLIGGHRPPDALIEPSVEPADLTGNEMRVRSALAGGALTRPEIERSTDLPKNQVARALSSLRDRGLVRMVGRPRSHSATYTLTG